MTSDKGTRKRVKFEFWLDVTDGEQAIIAEYLIDQKTRRKYHNTLRDALKLLIDLRDGSTYVLHDLFPLLATSSATEQFNAIFAKLNEITTSPNPIRAERGTINPRSMPDEPTIELEIRQAKSDENANYNMLLSGLGMGICKIEDLPAAVIDYGIAKGRLPESARKKTAPKGDVIRAIAGANTQLTLPDFDDLELGEL